MQPDVFGNLMEWGDVLETLEGIRNSKSLDDHQTGLVRILRYPRNWRLREAVLKAIGEINQPSQELLKETLHIALNEDVYLEARKLAVDALAELMIKDRRVRSQNEMIARSRVLDQMESLMGDTHSPLLKEGIERFFKKLADRKTASAAQA